MGECFVSCRALCEELYVSDLLWPLINHVSVGTVTHNPLPGSLDSGLKIRLRGGK